MIAAGRDKSWTEAGIDGVRILIQGSYPGTIDIPYEEVFAKQARLLFPRSADRSDIEAVIKAYRLYLEQMPPAAGEEPLLSLTRAWTLIRFFDSKMLTLVECRECHGHFVSHTFELNSGYRCGLCHPPSRAGKKKKVEHQEETVTA